jgi:hypothetical protein
MPYGKFKSVEEVATKFDIEIADRVAFVSEKELIVADILQSMMITKLHDETSYVTEFAVCDAIIRPILDIIAANYHLKVWSHVPYNVDEEQGLVGEPDYLIAPKTKYGGMARPALCIIEAKKDDFEEGWTQALSEMVASALLGAPLCYGIVTTGAIWQFGKLAGGCFVLDPRYLSATTELQRVFNTVNWVFYQIS